MQLVRNLRTKERLGYLLVGLALIVVAVAPVLGWPWSLVAGIVGAVIAVEGLAGF